MSRYFIRKDGSGGSSGSRSRPGLLLLAGWVMLVAVMDVSATARLQVEAPVWPLTTAAEFWLDSAGQADYPVASHALFKPVVKPYFGNQSGALWLRLTIDNPGSEVERVLRVGPAMLKTVDFFQEVDSRLVSRLLGGLDVPQSKRPLPGRFSLFPVVIPHGESRIYIRLAGPSKLNPDLSLWKMQALQGMSERFEIRTAVMLGGLLMTGQMSLLYGFWMREWIWGAFGSAILSYVVYQACYEGFTALWLWPESPVLSLVVLAVSAALCQALLTIFFLGFMPLSRLPRVWRLLWGLPVSTALGLLVVLLVDYRYGMPIIEGVGAICAVVLPMLSLAAWRAGFQSARFALMSFGLIYASTLLRVGMLFGWWPSVYMADVWLMPLSGVFASAFLLLALIEQVRDLRVAQSCNIKDLAEARDSAYRANRAKSLFLARVSHDLRTPLQVLAGYLVLAQRENVGGTLGYYLDIIANSGRNMLGLIDELLQFARGEEGRLELNPRPVLIHAWVRELAVEGEYLARGRSNRFVLELDLPMEVVEIDGERLRSVLMNLLGNACRLTQSGTITLSLSGNTGEGSAQLAFAVSDTGPGIAVEDQERIFEAFEQGHASRQSSGLGLAICRQLVRLMGSELMLDSRPGYGATFYFTLSVPVLAESDVLLPQPFNAPWGYDGPVRSLLVVDDVHENRLYLQDLLTGMGFDVVLAHGVEEALTIWGNWPVDGAIVDQYLPDGTGWDILDALKADQPDLPVVLLSAAPPVPPAERASLPAFDAELLKPVRVEDLSLVLGTRLRLVWRTERPRLNVTGISQTVHAGPMTREDLLVLRQAAHEGRLFEVEDWIEQWRLCPEERSFLDEIGPLVLAVRLRTIVELVDMRLAARDCR